MIEAQTALTRHRLGNGHAGAVHQVAQRLRGSAVDDTATGDDQRPTAGADPLRRALERGAVSAVARNVPGALLEKPRRIRECLRLDVLGQRHGHGAGVRWTGQHAHRLWQRGQQLFGSIDAVPVAAGGLEAIVDGNVLRMF